MTYKESLGEEDTPPFIPPALLDWLNRQIPHRCPPQGMPLEDIWFYSGGRRVVDMLTEWSLEQQREESP